MEYLKYFCENITNKYMINEFGFLQTQPLILDSNANKQGILQYYKDNNLTWDNDYLQDYVTPKTTLNTISPTTKNANDWAKEYVIPDNLKPIENIPAESSQSDTYRKSKSNDKAQQAINFLMNKGLNREAASGFVGNLKKESGLNENISGDNGTSFGIAQWHNARWLGLKNFAKARGTKENDFNTQLEYLWNEINTVPKYKNMLNQLKISKTPEEAATIVLQQYELPKDYKNISKHQDRLKFARQLYNS